MTKILTVNEVANILQVSRNTLMKKINKGEIKAKNLNPSGRSV